MYVVVHPAETLLPGDGRGYNPRDIRVTLQPGNREAVTGAFRDDGRPSGVPARPERSFRIVLPVGFDAWQSLNMLVFYALQSGACEIDLALPSACNEAPAVARPVWAIPIPFFPLLTHNPPVHPQYAVLNAARCNCRTLPSSESVNSSVGRTKSTSRTT
jgi:hypothetical protein